MYVGKIRVSHKRVPFTFIDDALPKFKAYDAQRRSLLAGMTKSSLDNVNGSNESIPSTSSNEIQIHVINETAKDCSEGGEDKSELDNIDKDNDKIDEESGETNSVNETTETQKRPKKLLRGTSQIVLPVNKNIPKLRDRSASIGSIPLVEQNERWCF